MTSTSPADGFAATDLRRPVSGAKAGTRIRDPRLDFFRGLAMFLILISHTPGNAWALWIPARWGFSDAAAIFVFCSGMASAIAFGATFDRAGWALGTARVAYRVWQIYWTHICTFLLLAVLLAAVDAAGWHPDKVYIGSLNLWKLFEAPAQQLIGLLTLTYVPNYFDILPMYMAVLAMVPLAMALSRISLPLLAVLSIAIWLLAQRSLLDWIGLGGAYLALPAEPWSDRVWFFNPFAWQLLFFTGFAFLRGWLPAPPVRPDLLGLAIAIVLASFVLSSRGFWLFETAPLKAAYIALTGCVETGFGACNPVFDWRQEHAAWYDKTDFSILHYVHFLALAYLAWAAAGTGGVRLIATGTGCLARIREETVAVFMQVGQQSLAVFVFSMVLAQVNGYLLDIIGRNAFTWTLINLTGLGLLVACAQTVGWFKSQPWKTSR